MNTYIYIRTYIADIYGVIFFMSSWRRAASQLKMLVHPARFFTCSPKNLRSVYMLMEINDFLSQKQCLLDTKRRPTGLIALS